MFKIYSALITSLAPIAFLASNPLNPGTPSPIVTNGTVEFSTVVAGSSSRFVATWVNNSNGLFSALTTDNGTEWSIVGSPISSIAAFIPRICSGSSGFVIACPTLDAPGFNTYPAATFSSDGSSWSPFNALNSYFVGGGNIAVAANANHFMITFTASGSNGFACFSPNGTTWSDPVQINPTSETVAAGISITVAGRGSDFLAAWMDTSSNAQTRISFEDSEMWSAPVALTSDMSVASEITLCATSAGYLAAWVNSSGYVISRFSADGSTWEAPVTIATDVNTENQPIVGLSGSSDGFVAVWQDVDSNAQAKFSSDNGATWSAEVEVASNLEILDSNIVGVSLIGDNCLFTWTDSSGNNFSAYSSSSSTAPRAFTRPSNRR